MLELVGAPNMAGDLKALATGGRIVVIGVGAGFKAEVNLLALMGKRGDDRAARRCARGRSRRRRSRCAASRREVLPLFESGALNVPVAATFPLDEAEAAYERFTAGGKLGKIVLTV